MKNSILLLILALFAGVFISFGRIDMIKVNDEAASETEILFFHNTPCASCDGTAEMHEIIREELSIIKDEYPYVFRAYNVFSTSGYSKWEKTRSMYGLDDENDSFPCLVINGTVIYGMDNIRKRIREQVMVAAEEEKEGIDVAEVNRLKPEELFSDFSVEPSENTAVYFYRLTCKDCEAVKDTVNAVPEAFNLIKFNTRSARNGDRIRMFFEKYDVPEERQQVPIVFFADTYLSGTEEINSYLQEYIEEGMGIGFTFPAAEQ